ncbi:hypothetical protein [Nocardia blacklockiae]|uniref:hypothetical protein n=1 Tax=Nocardia blacklockiae TaxID=480036 RepID=UPI0018950058|nr:hypothetical protein [Nocardia blacklockiae]MBF6172101.1 hypothetical protein [Nocardia blacklockiae]
MRHIHIESGALVLDFRAGAEQAETVAARLAQCLPGLVVTLDDDVRPGFPPLPCGELWN